MDARLVAIRERTEAATDGPWTADRDSCQVDTPDGRALVLLDDRAEPSRGISDTEFIAHAREDVPWLLAIAEAARSLHAGLTCEQDPMDVDERIERLGAALAVSVPVGEGER
jgi:hypothetical protein